MEINNPSFPVLVIGSSGLDIISCSNRSIKPHISNPAEIRPSFGGVARNIAENMARLGQNTNLISVVGKDAIGKQLLEYTTQSGVNTTSCLITPEFNTASYLAVLDADRKLQFALDDMRLICQLTPDYLNEYKELFQQASIIFFDANLSSITIRHIFHLAHKLNIPICADSTSNSQAKKLLPYLNRLFLLSTNPVEAGVLCEGQIEVSSPQTGLEAARYLINKGVSIVIISMGESGVCYANSETSGHIPSVRTPTLDPTGAGDALTATVLFGLLNKIELDEAVRLGISAYSLTLRHSGAVINDLSLEKLYSEQIL
jgi:pseudouridine kinase